MAKVTKEKRAFKAADVAPEPTVEKSAPKVIKAVAPKADVAVSAPKSTGILAGKYVTIYNVHVRGTAYRPGNTVELSQEEAKRLLGLGAVKKA